ncbi:MAG: outer membrane beta-barrel protein [Planctomycetota bacterium]
MKCFFVIVTLCVLCLSGLVYSQEIEVEPFWQSLVENRFDETRNGKFFEFSDLLADAGEPKVGFYGGSVGDSEFDGMASGSITPLSSSKSARRYLEIVPFSGYQIGGKFEDEETDTDFEINDASTWGFLVDYDISRYSQIEFYYSHQETELSSGGLTSDGELFDLDVDYYHLGGTFIWRGDKLEPYMVGTLGLTRFDPETSEADSMTRFSLGFGGGVRYFPIKRVGLYLGGRAFVTFVESEYTYRSDDDGTTIRIESNALWQFQFMAGVVIVF